MTPPPQPAGCRPQKRSHACTPRTMLHTNPKSLPGNAFCVQHPCCTHLHAVARMHTRMTPGVCVQLQATCVQRRCCTQKSLRGKAFVVVCNEIWGVSTCRSICDSWTAVITT